jgi:Potential Queuosine, Q, salvage protein family
LLAQRLSVLREAGEVLECDFGGSFVRLVRQADHSAARLVNLLVEYFPCFRDESNFYEKRVRFYKRAQILVADLWACFNGEGWGQFDDIHELTIFADYRIPQMLNSMGCLMYSPSLESRIRRLHNIENGENCEIELRGNSIWCVELIRRQIEAQYPEAKGKVNAVLIDFFLYDLCKEREREVEQAEMDVDNEMLPHHRTRSIWY